ncbi:MAG: exodeoxyribonuclease III [Bacteroidetes bacterium]|nr:exodeoxyribonuclease III [Bacteroidota bacterium]
MKKTKIITWNVNGIRSIAKKDFFNDVKGINPDILCLQETKAAESEVESVARSIDGYHVFANSSKARKGYSGTAILTREQPTDVTYDMGIGAYDQEGRIVAAEYPHYFVVCVYVPNAGEGLSRLDYRTKWNEEFQKYLLWLDKRKPVVVCGDLNVAHQAIDIARPKENYNKSAGYTQQEIDGMNRLLAAGFRDVWRDQHPDEIKYSYWNYWMSAREKNIGWRIDYVLVSDRYAKHVKESEIYNDKFGSDHCPVGIVLE